MKKKTTKEKPLTNIQRLLVEQHLQLAVTLSRRYAGLGRCRGITVEDLQQEACWGLCMAARRYDSRHGAAFPTYAYEWCRKFVLMAIDGDPATTDDDVELLADRLPDDADDDADEAQLACQRRAEALMARLEAKERQVIALVFGLDRHGRPSQPKGFKEVAATMHICLSRVRAIYEKAMTKMEFAENIY